MCRPGSWSKSQSTNGCQTLPPLLWSSPMASYADEPSYLECSKLAVNLSEPATYSDSLLSCDPYGGHPKFHIKESDFTCACFQWCFWPRLEGDPDIVGIGVGSTALARCSSPPQGAQGILSRPSHSVERCCVSFCSPTDEQHWTGPDCICSLGIAGHHRRALIPRAG